MIAAFLCSIAGGMLLALSAARLELIVDRFVRLVGAVAFAASVGVSVWSVSNGVFGSGPWRAAVVLASVLCSVSAAVLVFVAPLLKTHPRRVKAIVVLGGASGIVAAGLWLLLSGATPASSWLMVTLIALGQVLGSFVIGTVTVAWLLGHAYLTASKMTIAPLRRLSRLFTAAVAVRFVYLVLCVLMIKYGAVSGVPEGAMARVTGAWLILSLRVVVGLIALGGFAYMVGDCVKIRSTQSATGILYFASVFAYIGELSSQHLVSELGLPL